MRLNRRTRNLAQFVNALTILVVLGAAGVAAWFSHQHPYESDWTRSGRNTLSTPSIKVLETLTEPLKIEVFARNTGVRGRVLEELLKRYRQHKPDLTVTFTNPDLDPERLRELSINRSGSLLVTYGGRQRTVEQPSERTLTNTLLQLARKRTPIVAFLTDHGERRLDGKANHDLGAFGQRLKAKGFSLIPLSLARAGAVPANTGVLVIAGPRVALLPAELALIEAYLNSGGNLLWLLDPRGLAGLEPLADKLGIDVVPGTLIDPATEQFTRLGLGDPTFAMVTRYGEHPALEGFNVLTIFPGAAGIGLASAEQTPWEWQPLLETSGDVWSERGKLAGTIGFDPGQDIQGPFHIALAGTRTVSGDNTSNSQRVIVVGDGDFLSNAALGNSGNLDLGLRLLTWLSEDDQLVDIPARADNDSVLELSALESGVIGLGALLVLPLLLAGVAATKWWRRRHR